MIWPLGAIIAGVVVMTLLAVCGFIALAVRRMDRVRDRLDEQAPTPEPRPWTVKPVGTPMLADHGIPQLWHIYSSDGHHSCGAEFCYLTRTEAEAAARLGEQFTAVVADAVNGGMR